MIDFEYEAPTTLKNATELLTAHAGKVAILAGGTDILVQIREGHRSADLVVDVKNIPDLNALTWCSDTGLTLGASVACTRVFSDEGIQQAYPALVDSARIIGGWQIQSRASIGGNLCNASPAADTIPSLIVHGGACVILGSGGERTVPVDAMCTGPGRNALQDGELLVQIQLPAPPPRSSSAYERFIPRNEMDIAVAGAASWIQLDESRTEVAAARIALGAVAPTPVVAQEAADWLVGKPAVEETFAQAGELAKQVAAPISDMRGTKQYRVHLASVLTKRTLQRAAERAAS
ncbi:MAG: xanthine dehydrogenase family protein subunit M [Planctomycetaceae bacterium]